MLGELTPVLCLVLTAVAAVLFYTGYQPRTPTPSRQSLVAAFLLVIVVALMAITAFGPLLGMATALAVLVALAAAGGLGR